MFDKTITVFNKYDDGTGNITWYPHVLHNCQLIVDKAAKVAASGLESADAASLIIDYQDTDGGIFFDGVEYTGPKDWRAAENREKYITFTEKEDFFFVGEFPEDPVNDEEYQTMLTEGFYDHMNKRYDDVYLISTVAVYTLIPHVEIGGS